MSISAMSYGITVEEVADLRKYCRSKQFDKNALLMECAEKTHKTIARYIYQSLVNDMSYEKMCEIEQIPYPKNYFYGKQRETLALFKKRVKEVEYIVE